MAAATGSPISATAEAATGDGGGSGRRARFHGLRLRLAVALVGLTVAAALIQGLCFWAVEYWIERDSLIALLDGELDYMIATDAPPSAEPPGADRKSVV